MAKIQALEFWRDRIGTPLAILLHHAGYDVEPKYSHLRFFLKCTIPALGPSAELPNKSFTWKSFMTDNHIPLELS